MARHKKIFSNNQDQQSLFLFFVLLIPLVLISIGDTVRFFFRLVFSFLYLAYKIVTATTREILQGINDWTREKTQGIKMPMVELPHISLPTITLPKIPNSLYLL